MIDHKGNKGPADPLVPKGGFPDKLVDAKGQLPFPVGVVVFPAQRCIQLINLYVAYRVPFQLYQAAAGALSRV